MKSKVHMQVDENEKIVKVQDKWNGKLPDNTLLNVSPVPHSPLIFRDVCSTPIFKGWDLTN